MPEWVALLKMQDHIADQRCFSCSSIGLVHFLYRLPNHVVECARFCPKDPKSIDMHVKAKLYIPMCRCLLGISHSLWSKVLILLVYSIAVEDYL